LKKKNEKKQLVSSNFKRTNHSVMIL